MAKNPANKRGRKPKLDAVAVAAALAELQGNVAAAAKRFDVDRTSVRDFIERHAGLQRVLADAREGMLDNAESSLYRAVLAGEAWAVCFFLKTQGKGRGYIEKVSDGDGDAKRPDGGLDILARLIARHFARPPQSGGDGGAGGEGPGSPPLAPEAGSPGGRVPE